MAIAARNPSFAEEVKKSFAAQSIMQLIGAELTLVEPGVVEISLPYRKDLTQQDGYPHAGIITTIADSASGYAAFSIMPAGSGVLSVEFKVNLLRPAQVEDLGQTCLQLGQALLHRDLLGLMPLADFSSRDTWRFATPPAGKVGPMEIIGLIIVGLIVGALGRLVNPGRDPMGLILTMAIGVAAVLLVYTLLVDGWLGFIIAVIVAAVLVTVVGRLWPGGEDRRVTA